MTPITPFVQKVERQLARFSAYRSASLKYAKGTVCFTFDDVRHSACTNGVAVLERHGVRGTFYVSGGLTGTANNHTDADVRQLVGKGHELGCHGFAHCSYQSISREGILTDLQRNRLFFDELGCPAPQNFAFPFGHVSPFSKRIVSDKFVSLRGIQPAINHSVVDLALLKSFPLYERLWTRTALVKVLEDNAELCGLLTFFAHGVVANPGEYDCSAELLDFAVRMSIATGNRVVPVRDALSSQSISTPIGRSSDLEELASSSSP